MDVLRDAEIDAVFTEIEAKYGGLDILVHSLAYAPQEALERPYVETSREAFLTVLDVSAYSFTALARRAAHLMEHGGAALEAVAKWKTQVGSGWNNVKLWVEAPKVEAGQPLQIRAFLQAYGVPTDTLKVELVVRRSTGDLEVVPLKPSGQERDALLFTGTYSPARPGSYVYGVRAVAVHPELSSPREVAFVRWAEVQTYSLSPV
ncbi:MAG: hypothetical protein C4332_07150 [Meiothermus sp.]